MTGYTARLTTDLTPGRFAKHPSTQPQTQGAEMPAHRVKAVTPVAEKEPTLLQTAIVDAAIRAGKITAGGRDRYLAAMVKDEKATTALLESFAALLPPGDPLSASSTAASGGDPGFD